MPTKYEIQVEKQEGKIISLENDLEEVEGEIKQSKKDLVKYSLEKNEKKLKEEKKTMFKLEAEQKRLEREIKVAKEQLVDFKDGFEHNVNRHDTDVVDEFAKNAFFEVKKLSGGLGDTTKKLQKMVTEAVLEEQRLRNELDGLINGGVSSLPEKKQAAAMERMTELPGIITTLAKRIVVLEERLKVYVDGKKELEDMLKDGKITEDEYKSYKKILKNLMKK